MMHSFPTASLIKCLHYVRADKFSRLLPIYRQQLYDAIGAQDDAFGRSFSAQLSIMSAQFVYPVWVAGFPQESWPLNVLTMAQALIDGTIDEDTADEELQDHWDQLYWDTPIIGSREKVYSAAQSAIAALGTSVYGRINLLPPIFRQSLEAIDENTDDEHWLPQIKDAAAGAAITWSGRYDGQENDLVRRFEFWQWWLTTALPIAWIKTTEKYRS